MFVGETILINSCDVNFGAVANVLVEVVFWVLFREFYHVVVASDFGDDGGGGDGADFIITFDAGRGVFCERSVGKKIDLAINNNLRKGGVKTLN